MILIQKSAYFDDKKKIFESFTQPRFKSLAELERRHHHGYFETTALSVSGHLRC
jgi:hypothetical protein